MMANLADSATSNPARRRYLLGPNVVLIPLADGTAGLVDLDGSAFHLSETASLMLHGVLASGEEETSDRIAVEHGTHFDKVRGDLTALLATLRARGLIRLSGERRPDVKLGSAIAITICYPALRIAGRIRSQRLKALMLLPLARLCFGLTGWVRTVEVWRECLTHLPIRTGNLEQEWLTNAVESAIRPLAARLPLISCKERALCCWFMLNAAGVSARLVMGVQFSPFSGHCWCEVQERILADSAEDCKAYKPVSCYDG
jgi:hypothetical protein